MVTQPIENAAIDLAHAAAELAEARRTNERLGGELGDLRAAFNERHAPLIAQLQESATKLHAAEDAYRRAALTEYKATGNKHPGYGAGIRVKQVVRYDAENVVAWAKDNAPAVLRTVVDTKAFEAMVKASPATFEAVALVDEEPSATIPTDNALLQPDPWDLPNTCPRCGVRLLDCGCSNEQLWEHQEPQQGGLIY